MRGKFYTGVSQESYSIDVFGGIICKSQVPCDNLKDVKSLCFTLLVYLPQVVS